MRLRKLIALFFALLVAGGLVSAGLAASAGYALDRQVLAAGGQVSASTNYQVAGTFGQFAAGAAQGANAGLTAGFVAGQPAALPATGTRTIFIPIVRR